MKFLIPMVVMCLSVSANAQESMFFAAGYVAHGADLFMGASNGETHFVSTEVKSFVAVPNTPDQAPKPVEMRVYLHHAQAPKQAPTACQPMIAYRRVEFRRTAPLQRGWAERRSERRAARASRGG